MSQAGGAAHPAADEPTTTEPTMAATPAPEPAPHDHLAAVPVWPWQLAAVLDTGGFLVGGFAGTVLALGEDWPRALVLVYFLFFFGWAVLRAAGAPPTAVTAVAGVALGIASTITAATVAVTALSWAWEPTAGGLIACGLLASGIQRWRALRGDPA